VIPTWRVAKNGDIYLNQIRRYVRSKILVPPVLQNPVAIAAAPGVGQFSFSPPIIFEASQSGVCEVFSMMGQDLGTVPEVYQRLLVRIEDTVWRRILMNRDVPLVHVVGTGQQPYFLNEAIFLEGQQTLKWTLANPMVGAGTIVSLALEGRSFQNSSLIYEQVSKYIEENRDKKRFLTPYWLTLDQNMTLPAGGTVTGFFTVTRDIFFLGMQLMGHAIFSAAPPAPVGNAQEVFEFQLFDAKTDRPLVNSGQFVTWNTGFGNANFPFPLPEAWLMEPNTMARIVVRNLLTNKPVDVFLTIAGVACYSGDFPQFVDGIEGTGMAPMRMGAP